MARTGFCDSKLLLDFHHKVDERRVPSGTWACVCGFADCWKPLEKLEFRWDRSLSTQSDCFIMSFHEDHRSRAAGIPNKEVCVERPLLLSPHCFQTLVPSLLRPEVEHALEKLGLIGDRTFAWDVFLDMMKSQSRASLSDWDPPPHFTDATRMILVDWLIQVHEMMHFQEETLFLAVHLLNRSLRLMKVTTANLQLLAIVCLFLAAKKEESLLPEVSGLCYLMDHTYSRQQLLRMERKVLCALKFDLSFCPPLLFLHLLATMAHCSSKVVWMSLYLLELSLLEARGWAFPPLRLAGAALCLARRVLQEPPTAEGCTTWALASSILLGDEATLLRITRLLAGAAVRAAGREGSASALKFSSAERLHVSRHPNLKNAAALLAAST